jgi:hypothetical protein
MRLVPVTGGAALALGLVAFTAWAQAGPHRVGFIGGMNFATVVGDGTENFPGKGSRLGAVAGAFADFRIGPRVSLAPELVYAMKGFTVNGFPASEDDEVAVEVEAEGILDFIEIPLLIKLHLATGNRGIRPHLFAGPAVSLRTTCKVEGRVGTVAISLDCDAPDVEGRVRRTDVGVLVGAGLGIGPLFVAARYDIGLMNLNDDPEGEAIRTRALSLLGGVSIPLGRQ